MSQSEIWVKRLLLLFQNAAFSVTVVSSWGEGRMCYRGEFRVSCTGRVLCLYLHPQRLNIVFLFFPLLVLPMWDSLSISVLSLVLSSCIQWFSEIPIVTLAGIIQFSSLNTWGITVFFKMFQQTEKLLYFSFCKIKIYVIMCVCVFYVRHQNVWYLMGVVVVGKDIYI